LQLVFLIWQDMLNEFSGTYYCVLWLFSPMDRLFLGVRLVRQKGLQYNYFVYSKPCLENTKVVTSNLVTI
jgi:hypothetical protein